ncbi:MAG: hypothetical protein J6S21_01435 [Victivallales bacterium]|nr:hypothetical protein [Victivallales bacterium]
MRLNLILLLNVLLLLWLCSCTHLGGNVELAGDVLHYPGAEELPALQEYFQQWRKMEASPAELPAESRQPQPPLHTLNQYTYQGMSEAFPALLRVMTREDLGRREKNILENQAILHLRNTMLLRIYRCMEDIRHSKADAVAELREAIGPMKRICRQLPEGALTPELAAYIDTLDKWCALQEATLPLPILGGLWAVGAANAVTADSVTVPMKFSASWQDADEELKLPEAEHIWMNLVFLRPTVAAGRKVCMLLPPLPPDTQITLNDTEYNFPEGTSTVMRLDINSGLTDSKAEQCLAFRMRRAHIGKALLPPVLLSIQEQP